MKKLTLFAALCLMAAPAAHSWAQPAAPATPNLSRNIVVSGEVGNSGYFPFVPGEKLTELLKRAGGANSAAALAKSYVLREGVKISLDLLQPATENFVLREGDVLIVPRALRLVYVIGDVARPGAFSLSEPRELSIIDVLNAAGGTREAPDTIQIRIMHGVRNSSVQWYRWPEDAKILSSPSFLQADDVIYVQPPVGRRGWHLGKLPALPFALLQ